MSIVTTAGPRASTLLIADPFDFVHRVEVRLRRSGETVAIDPDALASFALDDLVPVRRKRSHVGAPNFSGLHFHATLRRHVWFESRLEQQFVELTECDDTIVCVVSQPMRLHWVDGHLRTHVPDYLVRHRDGRLRVVNVRPPERVADSGGVFDLVDKLAASIGIEAEVFVGLSDDARDELSFLHRFRLADPTTADFNASEPVTPRWVYEQHDPALAAAMWTAIAHGHLVAVDGTSFDDDTILVAAGAES